MRRYRFQRRFLIEKNTRRVDKLREKNGAIDTVGKWTLSDMAILNVKIGTFKINRQFERSLIFGRFVWTDDFLTVIH